MTHRRPHGLFTLTLAAALAVPTFAQIPGGPPPPPPPPGKKVVGPPGVAAVVNGERISTRQADSLAAARLPLIVANTKKQLVQQAVQVLIANALVDQEAKKQKVTVSPAEVSARLGEIKTQVARDPRSQGKTLDQILAENGETQADLSSNLRRRIAAEKLISKTLPPTQMVHARHILIVSNNPNSDPSLKPHSDAEARAIIAKAQAELKSGKSFEDVAKKYSEDPSNKEKGGDLGIIGTSTAFDPNFLKAALALKAGQVTPEPVKSVYGYHLIKVDNTSKEATGGDKALYAAAEKAVRDQQLSPQAIQAYVQSLYQKGKVVNYVAP